MDFRLGDPSLTIFGVRSVSPIYFNFLHDLVEKIVQEFMSILMHSRSKQLIELLELVNERTGCYGTLITRTCRDMEEK